MLGKGGMFIEECVAGGYIGANFDIHEDLSDNLTYTPKLFKDKYIPILLSARPEKTKVRICHTAAK